MHPPLPLPLARFLRQSHNNIDVSHILILSEDVERDFYLDGVCREDC